MRLNIAAGTAVRFEPGDTREVELVALGGTRDVVGINGLVEGPLDDERRRGRGARSGRGRSPRRTMKIDPPHLRRSLRPDHRRSHPPRRHGPADPRSSATARAYGDEAKFGGGKVIRDGMGQSPTCTRAGGRARSRHHERRHHRQHGHLQGRRRHSRRPHLRRSARPATPASWTASRRAWRSARRPRSSPARATSSPPAASTRTSTSSRRTRFPTRSTPASRR